MDAYIDWLRRCTDAHAAWDGGLATATRCSFAEDTRRQVAASAALATLACRQLLSRHPLKAQALPAIKASSAIQHSA